MKRYYINEVKRHSDECSEAESQRVHVFDFFSCRSLSSVGMTYPITKKWIYIGIVFFCLQSCDSLFLGEEGEIIDLQTNLDVPEQIDDGWETGSLTLASIDDEGIGELITALQQDEDHGIRSILVVRNQTLVLESYFKGWNRDRKQDLRSATKSFTSALMGIAIDKDYVSSINEPVVDFFTEYPQFQNWDEKKREMTIRHFLRMRTGLACNDWTPSSVGNEERMYETDDWVKFVLDLPLAGNPGEEFSYCTGAPVTLGVLMANASGISTPDFSREFLFRPMGITDYDWEFMPNGNADTGGHLHMKPRDMAKFGLLYLNKGKWKGEELVSSNWVNESTNPNGSVPTSGGLEYAYFWWTKTAQIGNRELTYYFASGNGGQLIVVVPGLDAVVVMTGGSYNGNWLSGRLGILEGVILAGFE